MADAYEHESALRTFAKLTTRHRTLATEIAAKWQESGEVTHIVDVGCGDGSLIASLLDQLPSNPRVTLVEPDPDLRRIAATRICETGHKVTVLEDFASSHSEASHLLASHVIYYLVDRERLYRQLQTALRTPGLATFVIRSIRCDTRRLRDITRRWHGIAPRLSAELIKAELLEHWPLVDENSASASVVIPTRSVDHLFGTDNPLEDLEGIVRWLAHIGRSEQVPEDLRTQLLTFLERRFDGNGVTLNLEDVLITVQTQVRPSLHHPEDT